MLVPLKLYFPHDNQSCALVAQLKIKEATFQFHDNITSNIYTQPQRERISNAQHLL